MFFIVVSKHADWVISLCLEFLMIFKLIWKYILGILFIKLNVRESKWRSYQNNRNISIQYGCWSTHHRVQSGMGLSILVILIQWPECCLNIYDYLIVVYLWWPNKHNSVVVCVNNFTWMGPVIWILCVEQPSLLTTLPSFHMNGEQSWGYSMQ